MTNAFESSLLSDSSDIKSKEICFKRFISFGKTRRALLSNFCAWIKKHLLCYLHTLFLFAYIFVILPLEACISSKFSFSSSKYCFLKIKTVDGSVVYASPACPSTLSSCHHVESIVNAKGFVVVETLQPDIQVLSHKVFKVN